MCDETKCACRVYPWYYIYRFWAIAISGSIAAD